MYTLPGRMLVIPLTAGNVALERAGKTARTAELKVGTADWQSDAVTESIRNLGTSGVEIVHVELK